MIDNAAILLSTLLTLYVVIRAISLDRKWPWYTRMSAERRPNRTANVTRPPAI